MHIAVLDIGKTNKKILVFDEHLKVLKSEYKNISTVISDGIEIEQAEETFDWFVSELKKFSSEFDISAISVTTHGATFACIGEDGKLSVPVISYTNDPGQEFQDEFFRKYGDSETLHAEFATSNMGGLANLAKGIEFARNKFPEKFAKTKYILGYPQFFAFMLTGKAVAEFTYIGCHSYLLDFNKKTWSSVAHKMGIVDKLPKEIVSSHAVLGCISPEIAAKTGLRPDVIVTNGIHDSNASFLPYLAKEKGAFILNSTGTWFVMMSPSKNISFTKDELDGGVFCNCDVNGNPVKTAIFMGGGEMNFYYEILKTLFGLKGHPGYDQDLYAKAVSYAEAFILPGFLKGTGPFPHSNSRLIWKEKVFNVSELKAKEDYPDFFKNPEYAYAVLNLSLAIQSSVMIKNVGMEKGVKIYVEGGFRKNDGYCALLAALCPDAQVVLSDMSEATSLGAALMAKSALLKSSLESAAEDIKINTTPVKPAILESLNKYAEKFLSYVKK